MGLDGAPGPEDSGLIEWILSTLLAGLGAVTSALVWLFKLRERERQQTIEELKTEVRELRGEDET